MKPTRVTTETSVDQCDLLLRMDEQDRYEIQESSEVARQVGHDGQGRPCIRVPYELDEPEEPQDWFTMRDMALVIGTAWVVTTAVTILLLWLL